jgi:hypothetical protein
MAYRILAALFAALFAAPALAQVPSTLPANSVLGRLGVTAGKPQAIPFDTLFSAANIQPVTANLTALLALGSTGFPTRTGANTWAQRIGRWDRERDHRHQRKRRLGQSDDLASAGDHA